MDAILLIAHGSRLPEANDDLRRVAEELRRRGHALVVASYLELATPGMVEGGRECVAAGAKRVAMAPWFLSAGTHVRRDLTAARDELAREFPAVEFVLTEPLGTHGKMVDVIEERVDASRRSG